jgi:hypothetical protein
MTALMTGPNPMRAVWNREKVTHSVQKTLRWMNNYCCTELNAGDSCFHCNGQEEVGCGKKILESLDADGNIF